MIKNKPLQTLAATLIIFLCGLAVFISQICFWSDSEMWAVTSNFHMFSSNGTGHNHFVKPLFGLYLSLVTSLGSAFNSNIMSFARLVFALQSLASVYLLYRLSLKISKDKLLSYLLILVLLATSIFWERSFRVRSDLLVLLVYLVIFNLLYSEHWNKKNKIICLLLMALSLLITPKSVVLAFIFFMVYYKSFLPGKAISKKYVFGSLALVLAAGLSYMLVNNTALDYFVSSFSPTGKGYSYFSAHRFEHILRFGKKNIWLLLLLVPVGASYFKYKKIFIDKKYFCFSILVILLLIAYPNRLPFFMYSLLPFVLLGLLTNPWLKSILNPLSKISTSLLFAVMLALVFCGAKNAQFIYESHNNSEQKEFQSKLCGYLLKFPEAKVLDPIGVCPERLNSYYFYLGPFHDNLMHIDGIKILKPDIILNIAKLQFLHPNLDDFLLKNYFYSDEGVFYKRLVINNPKGQMTKSQLDHLVKDKLGAPDSDFKIIYKNLVSKKASVKFKDLKDINLSKIQPFTNKSILTGYELIFVSPFNIEKLKLPSNANALFRHDVEI